MDSSNSFWARMELEMFLGPNVECLQCGHVFLQHEDGCPHCGAGAMIRFIVPEVRYEDCERDDSLNGYSVFWFKNGRVQVVSNKNFSRWPREEKSDDVFCWSVFDKETGQFHMLDGSLNPWPREETSQSNKITS